MDLLTDENNKVSMVDCCLCQTPPVSKSCDSFTIDRFHFLRGLVSARHSVWAPWGTWLKSGTPSVGWCSVGWRYAQADLAQLSWQREGKYANLSSLITSVLKLQSFQKLVLRWTGVVERMLSPRTSSFLKHKVSTVLVPVTLDRVQHYVSHFTVVCICSGVRCRGFFGGYVFVLFFFAWSLK